MGSRPPCTLCPPCPAAGSILGTGRASCLSTHKLPAPFASFLAGQLFLNSKWSFPSVFASSLLLRGVSAAPGDSPAEHSPAGAAGQPGLPAPLQPGRGGERRERRIRGRAADPCPPGEGGCGPRSVTSAERGRHPAGAGGAAGGRWDAHGFSLNSRALLSVPGSGPMGEGEQGSPRLLEFGIDFWPLLWLRIPPVPFCHLPRTPFLLGNY